jgi:cell division protein FtsB
MRSNSAGSGAAGRVVGYALFSLWAVVLSGIFEQTFSSPGVLQALELRGLLEDKQVQVASLEGEIRALEEQIRLLEKNDIAIEREIRRTLGYAASDELIYDFTASGRRQSGSGSEGTPESEGAPRLGARGRFQDSEAEAGPEGAGGQLSIAPALKRFFLPVRAEAESPQGREL